MATNPDMSEEAMEGISDLLHTSTALEHLAPHQRDLVTRAVVSVAMVTGSEVSEVGEAWVRVGLLNMALLAPQGPVDPVEKVAIKLHIATDQVYYIIFPY